MAWAVLLCLCSWWRWCRGSRLWSLFLFSSVVASSLCFCHLVSLQTILCLSLSVSLFFFSSSAPPFLFSPTSIYKQKERTPLLCPIVVRGGAGLPYLCRVRWLVVYRAWCPFLGRVWLGGYGFWQGFMQVGGRESEREKDF
jgi:hypothetical protein